MNINELTINTSTEAIRDTLKCLFMHGPTWDGNIPSKMARDGLERVGMVHHRFGYAWLTDDGVELCINLGLRKE